LHQITRLGLQYNHKALLANLTVFFKLDNRPENSLAGA
jgi:hypothetical protein